MLPSVKNGWIGSQTIYFIFVYCMYIYFKNIYIYLLFSAFFNFKAIFKCLKTKLPYFFKEEFYVFSLHT